MVSQNGIKIWERRYIFNAERQHRQHDILREEAGPTRQALQNGCGDSPSRAFKVFCGLDIVAIIVQNTNAESRLHNANWVLTNSDELYRFFGLLLLAGVYRAKSEAITQLWNEQHGRPIFNKTMSRNRFCELRRHLRFDDRGTREERRRDDKLAPIRNVIDIFATKCRSSYKPGAVVTVDEQLVTFRGLCPFKKFIPSKPGKYGMKLWVAADAGNSYCVNLQVYTGRRGSEREVGQGTRVVLELTEHLTNTGRHVVGDNFFTNIVLVRALLARRLTYLGTVRKNKGELPMQMLPTRQRQVLSSTFGFQRDCTIVSYVPKPGKAVVLMSSLYHDDLCEEDVPYKPHMILEYNSQKGGVDTLDQNVRCYSSKRKTNRWPFALFCNLLDIGAYNAFVLYTAVHPNFANRVSHRRRMFLLQLATELVKVDNPPMLPNPGGPIRPNQKRRCHLCPRQNDRKSSQHCDICYQAVCFEHSIRRCNKCQ